MKPRPTPKTDALRDLYENYEYRANVGDIWELCEFLERQWDEAREVLREIRDNEVNPEDEADKFLRDHVPSELSKVREQRDRLAVALKELRNNESLSLGGAAYEIVEQALQSLTPKEL